jgi:SAM-dependent methyltransferase
MKWPQRAPFADSLKKVYRNEDNQSYWDRRWQQAGNDAPSFADLSIYPIRYAERVVSRRDGKILEIGCGLGRIVKHYHALGREIVGIERSPVAVAQMQREAPDLRIQEGDALALNFQDHEFDVVLAFGVYHNIEIGLEKGIQEMSRVLKPGGAFVVSMRPDNIEMNLNEIYWRWKNRHQAKNGKKFHKWLVQDEEFQALLSGHGLQAKHIFHAKNLPLLFRIPFFQDKSVRSAEENMRRAAGYKLNFLGRKLDGYLQAVCPNQFSNVVVFEGVKVAQ